MPSPVSGFTIPAAFDAAGLARAISGAGYETIAAGSSYSVFGLCKPNAREVLRS